ncbi:hypothetical protein [Nannocystis pusilla]|uniref:hypothetical protein n=1 Tax=Nannocystis pusilla TaxID=889268 RepID=UPI003B7C46F9
MSHLRSDAPGFAVNSAVLFRSTHGIGSPQGIFIVNIDPDHPSYGKKLEGLSYSAKNGDTSGNNYICRNWLAVETIDGVPLDPGTTYAVLITDELRTVDGDRFSPDADFSAMLKGQPRPTPGARPRGTPSRRCGSSSPAPRTAPASTWQAAS